MSTARMFKPRLSLKEWRDGYIKEAPKLRPEAAKNNAYWTYQEIVRLAREIQTKRKREPPPAAGQMRGKT